MSVRPLVRGTGEVVAIVSIALAIGAGAGPATAAAAAPADGPSAGGAGDRHVQSAGGYGAGRRVGQVVRGNGADQTEALRDRVRGLIRTQRRWRQGIAAYSLPGRVPPAQQLPSDDQIASMGPELLQQWAHVLEIEADQLRQQYQEAAYNYRLRQTGVLEPIHTRRRPLVYRGSLRLDYPLSPSWRGEVPNSVQRKYLRRLAPPLAGPVHLGRMRGGVFSRTHFFSAGR